MEQIENEVIEWNRKTFPNATIEARRKKFQEELREFFVEMFLVHPRDPFSDKAAGEFVDEIIVYMSAMAALGKPTLTEQIRRKMEINKARVWGPEKADGSRERVR